MQKFCCKENKVLYRFSRVNIKSVTRHIKLALSKFEPAIKSR